MAHANYLVAWADFYAREGIDIESIAFTNEPDWNASYESEQVVATTRGGVPASGQGR